MTTQCDQSQDPFIPGPATFLRVNVLHNRCGLVGIVTTVRSGQREHPRLLLEVWGGTACDELSPAQMSPADHPHQARVLCAEPSALRSHIHCTICWKHLARFVYFQLSTDMRHKVTRALSWAPTLTRLWMSTDK